MTDAGTLVGHLVTGVAAADGRGRYVAVCGAWVLLAALTAEQGFCLACVLRELREGLATPAGRAGRGAR
ncbi:MAG: hypothetical protein ACRDRI_11160 [Pseudonocardiaceae bacterium]